MSRMSFVLHPQTNNQPYLGDLPPAQQSTGDFMPTVINPFYAARNRSITFSKNSNEEKAVYAKLPLSPITSSPVQHLTSLYHFDHAGGYGNRKYPGNCGGNLIKDLLRYFNPKHVFDPMTGSGTCKDVCDELNIECFSSDMREGIDACDASQFPRDSFDLRGYTRPIGE